MLLKILRKICNREPDVIIGGADNPYLRRWHIIPRNRIFNLYLHYFTRSDDDRALHDHPWSNFSYLLEGTYKEHTIRAGGINYTHQFNSGDFRFRLFGSLAHRIELTDGPVWTLFVTGPVYRKWGFHCPKGWVYYREFVSSDDVIATDRTVDYLGKGCGEK